MRQLPRLAVPALLSLPLLIGACTSTGTPVYIWDPTVVTHNMGFLLEGLALTLLLTLATIITGLVLGLFVAAGRLAHSRFIRVPTTIYIEVMRGTPALVQLVWIYYALPVILGVQLPAIIAALIALTLNVGAFYGEAFRSGIQAVPRDQVETADVLGLSYFQRMRFVIAPQAIRTVLPVLISTSIALFKDTSLVSAIGVADLMYNGRLLASQTYRPLELLTAVAVFYFAIAFPFTILMRRLEVHLSRHRVTTR